MPRAPERRAHPRAAFRAWVEIAMEGRRFLGRGRDLSQGGISVWLDGDPPPVGSQLNGEFQLPDIQLPLMLRARVVWTERASGHVGLRFENMDPSVEELLENYVAGRF